eukprot:gene40950-50667_t
MRARRVAGRRARLELAAGAGALGIDGAADLPADVAFQRRAARRPVLGAAHRHQMRCDRHHHALRHRAARMHIRFAPDLACNQACARLPETETSMPPAALNAADTAALIPFPALVDALRLAVAQAAQGVIDCPARQVVPLAGGGVILSMVATAPDIAVHKLITVVPGNSARGLPTIAGQVSVLDAGTGAVVLTLDGATVTGRRTAALSMLGIATLLGRAPRRVVQGLRAGADQQHVARRALAVMYPQAAISIGGRTGASAGRFIAEHLHTGHQQSDDDVPPK